MFTFSYSQIEYHPKHIYRLFSENDFWNFGNKTDIYYTQGLKFEYMTEIDSSKFKNSIFSLKKSTQKFSGYSIGQNIYTSSDISISNAMPDDRPYSAWTYVSAFLISNDSIRNRRLTSEFYFGVIGPIAQGKFVQTTWHELIKSPEPRGWNNQIKNDIGINLMTKFEFSLLSLKEGNSFTTDIVPITELQIGSVFNKIGIGLISRISILNATNYFKNGVNDPSGILKGGKNHYFSSISNYKPNFCQTLKSSNISLFGRPILRGVIYNSTLQGGIFSSNDIYVIDSKNIERFYFSFDYGLTWSTLYFDLSYSRAYRTREFSYQSKDHHWGQLYITVKI